MSLRRARESRRAARRNEVVSRAGKLFEPRDVLQ
jgi:hypothetical protein